MDKTVVINSGPYKGVRGRVTHVNAGRVDVETSRGDRMPGKINVKES
jgi:ribosomal protein L24